MTKSNLRHKSLMDASQREIQHGRPKRAQQLLLRLLKQDPENQQAWLWLAETFDDEEKAIRTLAHLLKINPQHAVAKKRYEQLQQQVVKKDAQEPVLPQNGRLQVPYRWLLLSIFLGLLAAFSLFTWFNRGDAAPTLIERRNSDGEATETLRHVAIMNDWECTFNEPLGMSEFSGQLINQHNRSKLESYSIRVALLNDEFKEVGSNISEPQLVQLAAGETADFSIFAPNPTGSDICLIELVDATFSE